MSVLLWASHVFGKRLEGLPILPATNPLNRERLEMMVIDAMASSATTRASSLILLLTLTTSIVGFTGSS
jgi:hypothetical protein